MFKRAPRSSPDGQGLCGVRPRRHHGVRTNIQFSLEMHLTVQKKREESERGEGRTPGTMDNDSIAVAYMDVGVVLVTSMWDSRPKSVRVCSV